MRRVETPWSERSVVVEGEAPLDWFSPDELAIADSFKLAKRRDEWLLGRAAVKQLALDLGLASDPWEVTAGRPHLLIAGAMTPWFVSLSHSSGHAGAAIADAPIGIDVQVVREMPEEAAHLFLSDEEAAAMRQCALPHRLLHFWCAKEAAWKREGGRVLTLKQLPVPFAGTTPYGASFDGVETRTIGDALIFALTSTSREEP
jgi:phosphopantetheinyl transferase